jgi:hypothetical protein
MSKDWRANAANIRVPLWASQNAQKVLNATGVNYRIMKGGFMKYAVQVAWSFITIGSRIRVILRLLLNNFKL